MRAFDGVPLIGFVAASGTGKTTLLTKIIPLLNAAGLRVGCVKHTHHPFEIDRPGKDSYRLRKSGASQMLIGAANRWALVVETENEDDSSLESLLSRLHLEDLDLVLVEGFRLEQIPKIEVRREELQSPLICADLPGVFAIVSNGSPPADTGLPTLDINIPQTVADFIVDYVKQGAPSQTTG